MEMATHSSTFAWKIPWKEEPGELQSMGSQRVGHDRATSFTLSSLHRFFVSLFFFFAMSLLSGTTRWFRFFLYISWPNSRISHFSLEPSLLLLVLETKIWVLDVLVATGFSLLLSSLSWQNKVIYVCICHHTFVQLYTMYRASQVAQW